MAAGSGDGAAPVVVVASAVRIFEASGCQVDVCGLKAWGLNA